LTENAKTVNECVDVQKKLPLRDNENENLGVKVLQRQRQDSNHDGENIRDCNHDNSGAAVPRWTGNVATTGRRA